MEESYTFFNTLLTLSRYCVIFIKRCVFDDSANSLDNYAIAKNTMCSMKPKFIGGEL
jgi:hypothetical protein